MGHERKEREKCDQRSRLRSWASILTPLTTISLMLVSTLVPAGTTFSSFWYKYQLEGVMFRGRTSGGGLPPRGAGAGAGAGTGAGTVCCGPGVATGASDWKCSQTPTRTKNATNAMRPSQKR